MMRLVGIVLSILFLANTLLTAGSGDPSQVRFEEVSPSASGIRWVHHDAMSPEHYLPETMGPGLGFLDYNSDGWMDLYLVNFGESDFFKPTRPLRNALYRNDGDGTFTDVTAEAGVEAGNFGMAVAAADFDNDGYTDFFLTAYGRTTLYHNQKNGKFSDITEEAGVGVSGWTSSAAWLDYDNDGWLDLFVGNFVVFAVDQHISCGLNALGKAYYCVPRVFESTANYLFRNNGDRTFTEVGRGTEIGNSMGKALGVVATDVNNDGLMDVFVSNDTVQDFLFLNRGKNQWEEAGLFAGVGFSMHGEVQSGMGVEAADFDSDGWEDLFVANIDHQYVSLFKNNRDETFSDIGVSQGIADITYLLSGWGVKFFDLDNDGDLDLFMANGHPDDMIDEYAANVTYKEPLLVFQNRGGLLHNVSKQAGPVFERSFPARGLTLGDYDNDGLGDVAVVNIGQAPLLLRNRSNTSHHWLGVRLVGKKANRDAIGARITWSVNGTKRSRQINSGGSFMASHDRRCILGLGSADRMDWLEVMWPLPSGRTERFTDLPVDGYITITEGEGISSFPPE